MHILSTVQAEEVAARAFALFRLDLTRIERLSNMFDIILYLINIIPYII